MLNHHLASLLKLGCLRRHQIHVSLPINQFLDDGANPKEIPLLHEFILNRDPLAQPILLRKQPLFTLNSSKYADFLSFREGLDLITSGLWLTDIIYHHLAIASLF